MGNASGYRHEIDGLRAVAVLSVVLFHAGAPSLKGGFLGVDVFFVISGYVITTKLLMEDGRPSIAAFYERRARRILPALLTVLFASAGIAYLALPPGPMVDFSNSAIATLLFVANIYFWQRDNYFSEPNELTPLLHTWSLAVEEQYYLVFPLLFVALHRYGLRWIGAAIAIVGTLSLGAAAVHQNSDPAAVFYLAQSRAWQLAAGAMIAWTEQYIPRRQSGVGVLVGLVVIAGAVTLTDRTSAFSGSLAATLGSATVIYFGGANIASAVLANGPLRWVGLISYSFYLWHQPLFAFARATSINALTVWQYAALIIASAAAATATYHALEKPARKTWRLPSIAAGTSAAVTAALCMFLIMIGTQGLPTRYSLEQLAILNASPERGVAVRDGRPCRRSIEDACVIGAEGVYPTFAVLGDSHAEALTDALSDLLASRGDSAYVLTQASCPFIYGVREESGTKNCAAKVGAAFAAVIDRGIRNVIINDRFSAYVYGPFDNGEGGVEPDRIDLIEPKDFARGDRLKAIEAALAATLLKLLDGGVTIYYVLPIPEVGWHVPRTLVKGIVRGDPPLTTKLDVYLARHRMVLGVAKGFSASSHFIPVFPHQLMCRQSRCATQSAKDIWYTDRDHLSRQGAEIIVRALSKLIGATLPQPAPTISITFDHYRSTYDFAFPIMKKFGLVGTFYVDPRAIDREIEGVTSDQLRELQRAGWEIGAYSGFNMMEFLAREGPQATRGKLLEMSEMMAVKGFPPKGFAPSSRAWSNELRSLSEGIFTTVRVSRSTNRIRYPVGDPLYVDGSRMDSLSSADTDESLLRTLDRLLAEGGLQPVVVHKIGDDTDPNLSVPAAVFEAFCARVAELRDQGRLRVLPFTPAVTQVPHSHSDRH